MNLAARALALALLPTLLSIALGATSPASAAEAASDATASDSLESPNVTRIDVTGHHVTRNT
jgi:hypothetical protein